MSKKEPSPLKALFGKKEFTREDLILIADECKKYDSLAPLHAVVLIMPSMPLSSHELNRALKILLNLNK